MESISTSFEQPSWVAADHLQEPDSLEPWIWTSPWLLSLWTSLFILLMEYLDMPEVVGFNVGKFVIFS